MCELILDVINYCVWSCNMDDNSAYDKIVTENWKSDNIEIKQFLDLPNHELIPEGALTSLKP